MCRIIDNNRGLSLIELVVTMVILGILASLMVPSARMTSTRVKEIELKRNLREIRTAIDNYKKNYDLVYDPKSNLPPPDGPKSGYPKDFKELVDGHDFGGTLNKGKIKFLRRVPVDPFNPPNPGEDPEKSWGMRSTEDDSDSNSWGEQDLFDVYSKSDGTAIDGTKYKDW